ncbi:hypothetical protein FHS43_000263 [Streptosporangium becharense]|uniref:DUF5667 domain-containing protein n=1 Tax=Streptosporangium becharense TaxID=1816182 RepID=A0A7W9IGG9_9ACTN|nr:DUF5667 domain-containing protein [Streptosporangium becharense]MBB2909017.1 hypothetical protein [Streptosporangium becharense]MBB5819965.1 hypothetical protein [Streptosporangium becharense]
MGEWLPGVSRRSRTRVQSRVARLGDRVTAAPRPEFHARLRERLMRDSAPPDDDLPEPPPTASRWPPRGGPFPSLLSVLLAASAVVSGVWAYQSMPGDAFYPLKRAAESTLFHLSADDAERADRSLGYAETRAREVERLLGSGERKNMIGETLQAMEETTRSAVRSLTRVRHRDTARAGQLKRFVRKQHAQVSGMIPRMDVEDRRRASGYLDYIEGLAPPE